MSVLTFSHSSNHYVFRGKKLEQPQPGTYDASKWTPPTHQVFSVEIQNDGMWVIKLGGAEIASGDAAETCSRKYAKELIEAHCSRFLSED